MGMSHFNNTVILLKNTLVSVIVVNVNANFFIINLTIKY